MTLEGDEEGETMICGAKAKAGADFFSFVLEEMKGNDTMGGDGIGTCFVRFRKGSRRQGETRTDTIQWKRS